jgi:Rieske Fe-S protein
MASAGEPRASEGRRSVLKTALGAGLGILVATPLDAQDDPRSRRPQAGDTLVQAGGERKGEPIKAADVQIDARPLIAYPRDPRTQLIRDGSRLNQILLLKLEAAAIEGDTRARSAEGIVGYSAVCTHGGCDDWAWMKDKKTLKCPCHDSEFNPGDGARIVVGPATRRLASLPLRIVEGSVVVAGEFIGRLGIQQ